MGRLSSGVPQVPKSDSNPEVLPFRKGLPIWDMQDDIVETILSNQVVLIAGETGSGKTTQVNKAKTNGALFSCSVKFFNLTKLYLLSCLGTPIYFGTLSEDR